MAWSGEDRRNSDRDLHDLVIRIDANVSNMLTTIEDRKRDMEKHEVSDNEHFNRLYGMHGKLKWLVGVGLGITIASEFFLAKFFK